MVAFVRGSCSTFDMPLGQRPGEPKQNPEAANWQRSGSMTESFLVSQPPTLVMYVCRRGEEIKKEAKSEDEDAPYRVIGMVTVHVTDSCSGHVLGVVVVSVCLSGAVLSWMCLSLSLVLCRRGVCVSV